MLPSRGPTGPDHAWLMISVFICWYANQYCCSIWEKKNVLLNNCNISPAILLQLFINTANLFFFRVQS